MTGDSYGRRPEAVDDRMRITAGSHMLSAIGIRTRLQAADVDDPGISRP